MGTFEGYVGIRLWDGQLVDDVVFSLLFVYLCVLRWCSVPIIVYS